MINPKELRLGSLLFPQTKEAPHFKMALSVTMIGEMINSGYVFNKSGHLGGSDAFQPIMISEDWLRRLGFEMRVMNGVIHEWYIMCTPPNYKREFALCLRFGEFISVPRDKYTSNAWHAWMDSGDSHSFNIKHVHQLQNVYLFITGQELQIKDND